MKISDSIKLVIGCIILLVGCSPVSLPREKALRKMPDTYIGAKDSLHANHLTKSYFFTDEKLVALLDTALANNVDLLNAHQNIEIAKANTRLAKGARLPFVNAAVLPNLQKFGNYTMDGAGNKNTEIYNGRDIPVHLPDFYVGFQASWEADVWGRLKNRKKATVNRFLSSVEGKNWLQVNLVNTIAINYYELLALDSQLLSLQENLTIQEEVLAIIKVQKEAARSNELAVKQFQAQILNTRALAMELQQDILENEKNINQLLSRYPAPVERNTSWLSGQSNRVPSTGLPSQLLRNRPDIRMAEYDLRASRFDVMAARKAFYPTISLNATVGLEAFSPATLFKPQSLVYGLFGGLLAPVLNKSALRAEFNTQSANQLQALNNYQQTMITAFAEVYTSLKKLDNLQQMIDLKSSEVQTLEAAIEDARILFQANRADYLEVLTAQQNLLEARLALVQYKKNQNQESANLFKAVGGGWQ